MTTKEKVDTQNITKISKSKEKSESEKEEHEKR